MMKIFRIAFLAAAALLPALTSRAQTLAQFSLKLNGPAKGVSVAGSFNGWSPTANPMHEQAGTNQWTLKLPLAPGEYTFKYVINGTQWVNAPGLPLQSDGNGNTNSVMFVLPSDYAKYPDALHDDSITPDGVTHKPNAPFVTRVSRSAIRFTLKTRAGDVAKCLFLQPGRPAIAMHIAMSNAIHDTWEVNIPARPDIIRYAFLLEDGPNPMRLDADGLEAATGTTHYFEVHTDSFPPFVTPEWPTSAVFYQIFPDRFADGNPDKVEPHMRPFGSKPDFTHWQGGDIKGIEQHWWYLKTLGINAIYFNPIFEAKTYHGYDTTNYLKVDPHFGTNAQLKQLVSRAHGDGWHVILDGVFNHTGVDFPPFKSLLTLGAASPYKSWYFIHHFPLHVRNGESGYTAWLNSPSLPKLDVDSPPVRSYLFHVIRYWMKYAGIDGWRLDAADQVDPAFWRVFRKVVKRQNPHAYLVGEIWGNAASWLQGDEFDSVMNYRWRQAVLDFFANSSTTPSQFSAALNRIEEDYPPAADRVMFNILDSHDTVRINNSFNHDWQRERQAVLFQLTYPGTPCIYYGDEIGMHGGHDPDDRRAMIWNKQKWNREILNFYTTLIHLRESMKVLQIGSYSPLIANDAQSVFGFTRKLGNTMVVVLVNRSDVQHTVSLVGSQYSSLYSLTNVDGNTAPVDSATGAQITLPPYGWCLACSRP